MEVSFFISGQGVDHNHWTWGWVDTRADLDIIEKRKSVAPARNHNPDHPTQPCYCTNATVCYNLNSINWFFSLLEEIFMSSLPCLVCRDISNWMSSIYFLYFTPVVPCLSSILRFCASVREKFLWPRGQVYEMYRASVCTVKVYLFVMCWEQGVLRDRMVTYEIYFNVDYDKKKTKWK